MTDHVRAEDATPPLERGLWSILTTPFTADAGAVDADSVARLVALQVEAEATGLTALGVFGEAGQLSLDERAQVLEVVTADSDLPYVIGFPERDVAQLHRAIGTLLDSVARPPRGLMVQVASEDLDRVVEAVAGVWDAFGVPVVLQDYPVVSGVRIAPEDLASTVAGSPGVCAVKAEDPPSCRAIRAVTEVSAASAFGGLGGVALLDELATGAAGVMTGFSFPEALAATLRAWDSGGFAAAREAFAPWLPLVNFEAQGPFALSVRKEVLRQRGVIAHAGVRSPAKTLPAFAAPLVGAHLTTAAAAHRSPPQRWGARPFW